MLCGETWKPDVFRRLAQAMPPSMLIDVGANEGQTLLDFEKAGLSQLDTVAFEPNPACAYYLGKLIAQNGWHHVSLLPVALSDAPRWLTLEFGTENGSRATIVADLRSGWTLRRQVVPCFTLDHLIRNGTINVKRGILVKIDVEGGELEVLRGAQTTLRSFRPMVLCEVLWAACKEGIEFMQERNLALATVLRECDYEI